MVRDTGSPDPRFFAELATGVAREDLFVVRPDSADYEELAGQEAAFWAKPHLFSLESLERNCSTPEADRYMNWRLTGDARTPWWRVISRYGAFRCGLVLGTGTLGDEAGIIGTNPGLHVTFVDISEGALARRIDAFRRRFADRFDVHVADFNFLTLAARSFDLIVSASSIHHAMNLEHLAWQINQALTDDGRFFLLDYAGEPRLEVSSKKRRLYEALCHREVRLGRLPPDTQVVWRSDDSLSPFCGVRSDEILSIFGTYLREESLRTAATLGMARLVSRLVSADDSVRSPFILRGLHRLPHRVAGLRRLTARPRLGEEPAFLEDLRLVSDIATDSGLITPAIVFAVYRKRA